MKLLFDQNLARVLVRRLTAEYPESAHVVEVGLATATDGAIWEFARNNDYVIVSKDSDFRQLAFLLGPPPRAVWVRIGNVSTSVIEDLLRRSVESLQRFADSEEESLLILSPGAES